LAGGKPVRLFNRHDGDISVFRLTSGDGASERSRKRNLQRDGSCHWVIPVRLPRATVVAEFDLSCHGSNGAQVKNRIYFRNAILL
jgi:hypothetical protein